VEEARDDLYAVAAGACALLEGEVVCDVHRTPLYFILDKFRTRVYLACPISFQRWFPPSVGCAATELGGFFMMLL